MTTLNKFEIAELINNLKNRIEELEDRFKINNHSAYSELFLKNTRLALGIEDADENIKSEVSQDEKM
jgi:hypothetical protein